MKLDFITYRLGWISLIILSMLALLLATIPYIQLNRSLLIILGALSFCGIILISVFWFVNHSKLQFSHKELLEKTKKDSKAAKPASKAKKDNIRLDIQAVTRKITRKAVPGSDEQKWAQIILQLLASDIEIMLGIVYKAAPKKTFKTLASYAIPISEQSIEFKLGEGLHGRAAASTNLLFVKHIPEDYRITLSGLGSSKPTYLAMIPIVYEGKTKYLIEIAGFKWDTSELEQFFQIISRELSKSLERKIETDAI